MVLCVKYQNLLKLLYLSFRYMMYDNIKKTIYHLNIFVNYINILLTSFLEEKIKCILN